MMMNMFTMFDPNIKMVPINMMLMLVMMNKMINNNNLWLNKIMLIKLNKILTKTLFNKKMNLNFKMMLNLILPLMWMVTLINIMNLFPNMMSTSSMLNSNLSLTMMLWMTMMIMNIKNMNILFMNLSPKNTPVMLLWIINLIELNSLIFQIVSLTMRLTINMMLGHIITAMSKSLPCMVIYTPIELMIIIIQSYIFITLNLLNFLNTN